LCTFNFKIKSTQPCVLILTEKKNNFFSTHTVQTYLMHKINFCNNISNLNINITQYMHPIYFVHRAVEGAQRHTVVANEFDKYSCDCVYTKVNAFPCRHILYIPRTLELSIYDNYSYLPRWLFASLVTRSKRRTLIQMIHKRLKFRQVLPSPLSGAKLLRAIVTTT
jgi:hypothetical protein